MDEYKGYAREALQELRKLSLSPPDQKILRVYRANDNSFAHPVVLPPLSEEEILEFAKTVQNDPKATLPEFPDDPGDLFKDVERVKETPLEREKVSSENPFLGAHDPHLFMDRENKVYYATVSSPGAALRRSKDLIHWEYLGKSLKHDVPVKAVSWVKFGKYDAKSVWAPEVHVFNGEYRMYYSVSTSCHRTSYIGLAVSKNPEGPYTDMGEIVKTDEHSPVNAIDPNMIVDAENGKHYLNYGSYWNGIAQIELDPATGLRLNNGQPYFGRLLWKRHQDAYREIEGSYEIYNPDTGYYYLFVSYDSTVTDYNVRVARSRCINGPFYDQNGREVNQTHTGTDPDALGLKIVDCHKFDGHFGWVATGHNGLLRDGNDYFISYHSRPETNLACAAMHIRRMIFDQDGWPVVSPCQYTGEKLQKIDERLITGIYERIRLEKPDGQNLCRISHKMYLRKDGQAIIDSRKGEWKMTGDYEVEFTVDGIKEHCFILPCFDVDSGHPVLALTGRRSDGICTWGKKILEAQK